MKKTGLLFVRLILAESKWEDKKKKLGEPVSCWSSEISRMIGLT